MEDQTNIAETQKRTKPEYLTLVTLREPIGTDIANADARMPGAEISQGKSAFAATQNVAGELRDHEASRDVSGFGNELPADFVLGDLN